MKGYYQLAGTADGKFQFTLHSANREAILSSRLYAEKSNALEGISQVREHGSHEDRFESRLSAKGEAYFSLKTPEGRMIGTSSLYESAAARDSGIRSVIENCGTMEVSDATSA